MNDHNPPNPAGADTPSEWAECVNPAELFADEENLGAEFVAATCAVDKLTKRIRRADGQPQEPADGTAAPAVTPLPLVTPARLPHRAPSRVLTTLRQAANHWRAIARMPAVSRQRAIGIAVVAAIALAVAGSYGFMARRGVTSRNLTARTDAKPTPPTPMGTTAAAAAAANPSSLVAPLPPPSATSGTSSRARGAAAVPPESGTLVVNSEPPGAAISIDGRPVGNTPRTFHDVKPGEHRIVLTRGSAKVTQIVKVESAATMSMIASIQAAGSGSGWVTVSAPTEVDVFEGNDLLGTSRSSRIMLPEGDHTLRFSNSEVGYETTSRVTVEAGKVATVRLIPPAAAINVNASPWAEVWIDGQRIGETPIGNLSIAIGKHEVVFRHPELGEKTLTVMVKPGVPARVTTDMRAR